MMWGSLAAFFAVCVILVDTMTSHELEYKAKFGLRTPGEWEREWHQERYSSCRDKIIVHLKWACNKDIYKLKRSESKGIFASKRAKNPLQDNSASEVERDGERIENTWNLLDHIVKEEEDEGPEDVPSAIASTTLENDAYPLDKYLYPKRNKKLALQLLRSKRGAGITEECCSIQGCTWEEYAEYCTQNNRKVPHKRYDYTGDY